MRAAESLLVEIHEVRKLVNPTWYRLRYPDVAAVGIDPFVHYMRYGWREGRDPAPEFNTAQYLSGHPAVVTAGINPLLHYAITVPSGQRIDRVAWQRKRPELPGILFVLHEHGGGTARFAEELALHISAQTEVLFLRGRGNAADLARDDRGADAISFFLPQELDLMCKKIRKLGIKRVVVLHTYTFHDHIADVLTRLALPFDFIALDYYCVMAQPHLAGPDGRFVGEERLPPTVWQQDPCRRLLIESSERFIACSHDLEQRLKRLGISRPITVAPPVEPFSPRKFRCWPRPIAIDEPIRVLTIGTIWPNKGRNLILEAAEIARRQRLPIEFHVYGDVLPAPAEDLVQVHRSPSTLTQVVCRIWPHIAWFPFQVPETHSYALSDAMAHGLPILASAIGAIPDRLAGREHTWLAPWSLTADEWLGKLLAAREVCFTSPGDSNLADNPSTYYRTEFLRPLVS